MLYDIEKENNKNQFEYILFIDGNEKKNKSILSNEKEFRNSWKRPKWHILLQD